MDQVKALQSTVETLTFQRNQAIVSNNHLRTELNRLHNNLRVDHAFDSILDSALSSD